MSEREREKKNRGIGTKVGEREKGSGKENKNNRAVCMKERVGVRCKKKK